MNKIYTIILKAIFLAAAFLFLGFRGIMAQTIIAMQDFENVPEKPEATFVIEGGSTYTSNSPAGYSPGPVPFQRQGNSAHGICNGISVLTSTTDIDASAYSTVSISMHVASFSAGMQEGSDGSDMILVEISIDGGNSWSQELELNGNSNACWNYGPAATNSIFDGDNAPSIFAPAAGGKRTDDGYSLLRVSDVPGSSRLRLRITLLNNSSSEIWVIDELLVEGMPLETVINTGRSSSCIDSSDFIAAMIPFHPKTMMCQVDPTPVTVCINENYCNATVDPGKDLHSPFNFSENILNSRSHVAEDGHAEKSDNPFLTAEKQTFFSVETLSPNPIAGQMKVEFTVPEAGEVHISLCDMRGNQLFVHHFQAVKGNNTFEKDGLQQYPPGIYVLRLLGADDGVFIKVIKE